MSKKRENPNALRGDGRLPIINVEANCLAEATHKAIVACHDYGARVETPKQQAGMSLGYDADMTIRVRNPDAEPKICRTAIYDDGRGVMQYILEMTHGIHNHWKKNPEHSEWWGYTYNERFVNQIPFILARIKHDLDKKGRITGRDYQYGTWRAEEDVVLEQDDPPCLQRGQFRFLTNLRGQIVMNYQTDWRSRDLLKAWNSNNIAQIELMRLFRDKVSAMIQQPIKLGAYIDRSSSLHHYGLYIDKDDLEKTIRMMKKTGWRKNSRRLDDYFQTSDMNRTELKRLIAAQMVAESQGHGLNQPKATLEQLGFDVSKWIYPKEWDSWPKSWDREADPRILAR
ncbi:MAG: hypothetical protein NT076_05705 [Candidatus Pacearchaeota archaeon]|nr:hypothetical protein [Candidatus Pacearchaeota archaeon]